MFFDNFSSTKANTLILWLPHGSHLNLSFIFIIIMIIVPSLSVLPSLFSFSIPLSLSWSWTFTLLFKTLPVLFKPQVRSLLWFQSGRCHKNMVDKEATWWMSYTVIFIYLHAMVRYFIRQHTNKLFAPGHSCGAKLLAVRPPLRLNFIRLLRVVITSSVTSESTGRQCPPVTSLLLCLYSCKKLNTIFKWQTKKNRLEMSAWYRMALLFSIVIHV